MVMGMSGSSVTVAVDYTRTAQMIVLLIVMEKKDFVTIALKSTCSFISQELLFFPFCILPMFVHICGAIEHSNIMLFDTIV